MTTTTRKPRAPKASALTTLTTPEVLEHPAERAGKHVHQALETGVTAAVETVKDVGALVGTAAGYVGHFFKGLVKGH